MRNILILWVLFLAVSAHATISEHNLLTKTIRIELVHGNGADKEQQPTAQGLCPLCPCRAVRMGNVENRH